MNTVSDEDRLRSFLNKMEDDFWVLIADYPSSEKKVAVTRLRGKGLAMWWKLQKALRTEEALDREIRTLTNGLTYEQKALLWAQLKTLDGK